MSTNNDGSGNYTDREMTCVDCKGPFTYTARDQDFYAQQGWTEPKRCRPCRDKKKAERAAKEGGR